MSMKFIKQFKGLPKENYILFIGKLVTSMGSFVYPMLTFFMTSKLDFSDSLATLIMSLSCLLSLPAGIIGGKLADKYNKKIIIVIFDFISVGLYILASLLPFTFMTVIIIFVAGTFQNMESASYDCLICDYSSSEDRERAFSLNYLGFNLGFILGSSLSGILFENYTRLAFILNGLAIGISTILILLFINSKNIINSNEIEEVSHSIYEDPIDSDIKITNVLKERKILLLMLLVLTVAWIPNNMINTLLPLQLKSVYGDHGATIFGYLGSVNGATVIVFTPIFTYILSKLNEIPKVLISMILYFIGLIMFMVTSSIPIMFIAMFISTLGEVLLVIGGTPYFSKRVPLTHRGRINGLSTVISTLLISGSELGLSIMLKISNSNYYLSWLIFVVIIFISIIITSLSINKDRKKFPILYDRNN